jgi:hypothetical protein
MTEAAGSALRIAQLCNLLQFGLKKRLKHKLRDTLASSQPLFPARGIQQ